MDFINEFMHKHFGIHKYRPSVKSRMDAFYEYLPEDKNIKDEQVLARLSNTIV